MYDVRRRARTPVVDRRRSRQQPIGGRSLLCVAIDRSARSSFPTECGRVWAGVEDARGVVWGVGGVGGRGQRKIKPLDAVA